MLSEPSQRAILLLSSLGGHPCIRAICLLARPHEPARASRVPSQSRSIESLILARARYLKFRFFTRTSTTRRALKTFASLNARQFGTGERASPRASSRKKKKEKEGKGDSSSGGERPMGDDERRVPTSRSRVRSSPAARGKTLKDARSRVAIGGVLFHAEISTTSFVL